MGNKLFNTPKEVFEAQLNDIFSNSTEQKSNAVLRALTILLYSTEMNQDLIDLYNLVGLESFVSILSLFENRTITFPEKAEVKELILTALFYYYREIKNESWEEIRGKVPFEFSPISYASKIKKMNKFIVEKLHEVLLEAENE